MGLTRMWLRRASGAAGASLIAPAVVLLGAGLLAAGGLGGFGSLGQIATGPSLPDTGAADLPPAADADATELAALVVPAPAEPDAGGDGTGATPPPAGPTPPGGPPRAPSGSPSPPGGPGPAPPAAPPTGAPGGGAPTQPPGGTPGGGPVQDLVDTGRGVGESLPEPVGPVTGDIVDTLLGPPRGGGTP